MKFNGKHLSLFLAVIAGVESFSSTFTTNTRSISFNTKKNVFAPRAFGLSSLASAEESVESSEVATEVESTSDAAVESKEKSAEPIEEDISKIAYVVNLSYGA